jgi:hypothetical protein
MIKKVLKNPKTVLLFFACMIITDLGIRAQEVFTTSGDYFKNSIGSIAFTIGETISETFKTTNSLLTSGMNQPNSSPPCSLADEAFVGETLTYQNTWWKYTNNSGSAQLVTISSCHLNQAALPNEDAWDTFLQVYSDCQGTLIADNDNQGPACSYNPASSEIETLMNSGETIYMFWLFNNPNSLHALEEFYFTISARIMIPGDLCNNAIPLTLPVVGLTGSTAAFSDDYNSSPCSPVSNYMDGNDLVYTITLPDPGFITGDITGAYGSMNVLDICPDNVNIPATHCFAFAAGPNGGSFVDMPIPAGTYYVVISSWAPPQTVDYTMNLSFSLTAGIDDNIFRNTAKVYPNPTNGALTVSLSNNQPSDFAIEIVNMMGQKIYTRQVHSVINFSEDFDLSNFTNGIYFVKLTTSDYRKIIKVLKQ